MRHFFSRRVRWLLLMGALTGLSGCVSMMEALPAPPAFLVQVAFNGPYDADIPTYEINQIKSAGLMQDWAVPYIFMRVAVHFESVGDEERSIHFFNRAIDEFRKRNNIPGEGSAVSRKITALVRFGNLQAACLILKELGKERSKVPLNAFVLYNYGYYHFKKADYAEAHEYFKQALAANLNDADDPDLMALRRDTELKFGMTLILADYFPTVSGKLGLSDFNEEFYRGIRRNITEGLSHLKQIPALNEKIRNTKVHRYFPQIIPSSMECDVHNLLGLAYGIAGNTPEAVGQLEMAKGLAEKTEYHLGEADNSLFLNQVYLLDKNSLEGIKAVRALAEIADRYQLVSYSIWANMILTHYYRETGDIDRTMDAMNKALTLMEENSWLSSDTDFRGIALFPRQAIYEALLELCAGKSDEKGAFKTAERAKAAASANLLSEEVIGKTPAVQEDVKQMHFYRNLLARNYKKLLSPVSGSVIFMETVEKIDKARRAYAERISAIKLRDEALYALMSVAPPEPGDLQRLLDSNTTLFSYYISTRYLYVWVISKNGFHQERIRMPRNEVDQLVNAYLSALMSRDKSQADALAEKVYDAFLKPVIPFVYGDRIGFVPHGTLCSLPFASMRYVQSYLVDGFTVFYLPHAGILMKHVVPKKIIPGEAKAIIIADSQSVESQPSVGRAVEERDMLKRTFPQADYFVKGTASKDDLLKLAGNYDIIHYVTNGYPQRAALDSCFLLTADKPRHGCMSGRDIFRLQLSARVTVFGACRSESGRVSSAEEISAQVCAWLYAVSPQVMTQLWEVEDKTRTALMRMFYKNPEKSGDAADALRAAQNGMIQNGYGPSDWAAFILTSRY